MSKNTKSGGKGNRAANAYDPIAVEPASSPGKSSRSKSRYEAEPVQMKANGRSLVRADGEPVVQLKGDGGGASVHDVADSGFSGASSSLPHLDKIQSSFGSHDVSGVQAHVGGPAHAANESLGSSAYASGNSVAFSGTPDLHTAAHEAAHVVQQRQGVSVEGGVGKAGDSYEVNADAVADRVVQGKSAEDLLGGSGGGPSVQRKQVQFTGHPLTEALPEDAATPEHRGGRKATAQRQYSYEQYVAMWEEQQGRKMTKEEKETLNRGCIGITALNLTGGGNPPLDKAYNTFDQAWAEVEKYRKEFAKHPDHIVYDGSKLSEWTPVLFSKMFWSNQQQYDPNLTKPDPKKSQQENTVENVKEWRRQLDKPDKDAFPVDEKTGKVDMTGYRYDNARPQDAEDVTVGDDGNLDMDWHINFDYAFWDEDTQSFWHANHAQPGMKVYQSTRARFEQGYRDFDRTIYCVGFAKNYRPATLATEN